MSNLLPNDNVLLQGLLNKIINYRFTRNLDKELRDRNINHLEVSKATGRFGNWFNRSFNEIEDMRISTFVKSIAAISKILRGRNKINRIEFDELFDSELLEIASVSIDLLSNDIERLIELDSFIGDFFLKIRFYVDDLQALNNSISQEQVNAYQRLIEHINFKRRN